MKIKYCGPARDYSGYGEANRHDIGALVSAGVEVTTQIPVYTLELSDFGKLGVLASNLENRELGYKMKILHTTPNVYKQFMEAEKYHIGRAFWETDKVPLDFAMNLEMMDEIWTGSKFNLQAMRNAGITKPIHVIPEAIDTDVDIKSITPYQVVCEKTYKFYSIFEWTERKNPLALLEAYWKEFQNDENVSLSIKTYVDNFTPEKKQEIRQQIRKLKAKLDLKKYPKTYIYTNLMDRHQVYRFHQTFDCFVSAHRGEGWGIPQMEAMLMNNPMISTNCGGIHEYLTHKKDAMLIPFKLVPILENTRNRQWYTPDQKWADVDKVELAKAMRWIFDHQDKAKELGIKGGQTVRKNFSLEAVGAKMRKRLVEIQDELTQLV